MSTRIARHYPYTVHLAEGDVRVTLARMTMPQFEEFKATFEAMGTGRGSPPQKATDDNESAASERARLAAYIAYLKENAAWTAETLRTYVRIVPGDLVVAGEDGEPDEVVTDGARFAELHPAEAADLLSELWLQNGLTGEQKKTLASRRGFDSGLTTGLRQAAHGLRPETTATPAAPATSAPPEAAMASSSDGSSGTTAPSASAPVQSEP